MNTKCKPDDDPYTNPIQTLFQATLQVSTLFWSCLDLTDTNFNPPIELKSGRKTSIIIQIELTGLRL